MIRSFLMTTAALVALAGTAAAADLPSRRAPPPVYVPPPIPVFTWTGAYVGGQIGYAFGTSKATAYRAGGALGTSGSPSGVVGGAHIGYLYQTASFFGGPGTSTVWGIEGDVDGTNYRTSYGVSPLVSNSAKEDIQGSVRGRFGIAVDRALFYATGGAAFGGLSNTYTNSRTGAIDSLSHTKVGYTVGGGVEYALSNNWSARVEYRYTDFGTISDNLANSTGGAVTVNHRENDHRIQAGFSYKFGGFGPMPVVARY